MKKVTFLSFIKKKYQLLKSIQHKTPYVLKQIKLRLLQ